MPLNKVFFTLEYKEDGLGGRWKDSKTDLILSPQDPPSRGRWNTRRGSDIDSTGGSTNAVYLWNRTTQVLSLLTAGYESKELTEIPVTLKSLNEFKLGAKGTGTFYFRKKNVPITWHLEVMEYTP